MLLTLAEAFDVTALALPDLLLAIQAGDFLAGEMGGWFINFVTI